MNQRRHLMGNVLYTPKALLASLLSAMPAHRIAADVGAGRSRSASPRVPAEHKTTAMAGRLSARVADAADATRHPSERVLADACRARVL